MSPSLSITNILGLLLMAERLLRRSFWCINFSARFSYDLCQEPITMVMTHHHDDPYNLVSFQSLLLHSFFSYILCSKMQKSSFSMLLRSLGYNKLLNAKGQYDTCNWFSKDAVKRFSQSLSIFRTYPVLGSQKIFFVSRVFWLLRPEHWMFSQAV